MRFAWQGFSVEHPEGWAPESVSGDRSSGYVCLGSAGSEALHIRWEQSSANLDLPGKLEGYMRRLEADAKKAGATFRSDSEICERKLSYKYFRDDRKSPSKLRSTSGGKQTTATVRQGRGALFECELDRRVFLLELTSDRPGNSSLAVFRQALSSFDAPGGDSDRWSVFGLDVRLPAGLKLESRNFLAGKTQLNFAHKRARLEVTRWAFAEQIIAKHGLQPWARVALAMDRATVQEDPPGLRLTYQGPWTRREAIVKHEARLNQLVAVLVQTRDANWRPNWDWIS